MKIIPFQSTIKIRVHANTWLRFAHLIPTILLADIVGYVKNIRSDSKLKCTKRMKRGFTNPRVTHCLYSV